MWLKDNFGDLLSIFYMESFLIPFNWGLLTPITKQAILLNWFHQYVNSLLIGVVVFLVVIISYIFYSPYYFKLSGAQYSTAEVFCSLIPCIVILGQIIPSIYVLYHSSALDTSASLTVKITGHQWYWHYEYSDITGLEFDSFMKCLEDLKAGEYRLLEVDNRLVLPCNLNIRLCFTRADVIHRWSLPAAGIKVDCVPGILNVTVISFPFVGVYYGQCSEICGSNHTFMPICVEVTTWENFFVWVHVTLRE